MKASQSLTAIVAVAALAVSLPAAPASAREASSKTKDGCKVSVSRPYEVSTWQHRIKTTIRCESRRTYHYGSASVMADVSGFDDVVASRSLTAGTFSAGVTYTWTSTWSTGSTNGQSQYGRSVVKLSNWAAALVVESGNVDGVRYN